MQVLLCTVDSSNRCIEAFGSCCTSLFCVMLALKISVKQRRLGRVVHFQNTPETVLQFVCDKISDETSDIVLP